MDAEIFLNPLLLKKTRQGNTPRGESVGFSKGNLGIIVKTTTLGEIHTKLI